jgi:hypothetical protein
MSHSKINEPEITHVVATVEDDEHDPQVLFEGTKRECEAFIRIDGRITLTIKEI